MVKMFQQEGHTAGIKQHAKVKYPEYYTQQPKMKI